MNPSAAAQYGAYRQTQIQSASPVELVVMLYRGAIRFTKVGIDGVNRRDVPVAHNGFVRAQDIVSELATTLDFERGGEVAEQLSAIYAFVMTLLLEANVRKSVTPAEHAVRLLESLLSSWERLSRAQKSSSPTALRAS
ncbi:MAG: flagellar export chaperone FliS [Chloroflexi bacterium]|nr:flagellar export chaperone FliS [Chloroflexota bacterium]